MTLPLPDTPPMRRHLDALFARLDASSYHRRRRLLPPERDHLDARGLDEVLAHARRFIEERVAPAHHPDDGRQTPHRGHPVFIAQHATGTCCRRCLRTWHGIPPGCTLTRREVDYVVAVIGAWLAREAGPGAVLEPTRTRPEARTRARDPARPFRVIPGDAGPAARAGRPEAPPRPPARALILSERAGDGTVARRWLQLELFGGRA
jgi:hypothetical protein